MTTAFSTVTPAVVIGRFGEHRIDAPDADTGHLLGAVVRQLEEDCKWPGWHVECFWHGRWMSSAAAAAETLARATSDVDGA